MKLIAHRGNIFGPNKSQENKREYLEEAIAKGYDVEIDLWKDDQYFYLGHDEPQNQISIMWLVHNKNNLWIHCKNFKALESMSNIPIDFNYFWHENDKHTLTSKGYIWSYPGQPYNLKSIIVMPEKNDLLKFYCNDIITDAKDYNCFGICSDYVSKIII